MPITGEIYKLGLKLIDDSAAQKKFIEGLKKVFAEDRNNMQRVQSLEKSFTTLEKVIKDPSVQEILSLHAKSPIHKVKHSEAKDKLPMDKFAEAFSLMEKTKAKIGGSWQDFHGDVNDLLLDIKDTDLKKELESLQAITGCLVKIGRTHIAQKTGDRIVRQKF